MNIRKVAIILLAGIGSLGGCNTEPLDDPIPYQPFPEVVINLALPQYSGLLSVGGRLAVGSPGIRGVILYRESATTIIALERNCSYLPTGACATVGIHSSGLFLEDTCCGSTFDFSGNPTGSPGWRPLNRYATNLNGNTLTITDNLLN